MSFFGLVLVLCFVFLDTLELEISLYSTLFCSSSMCNQDLSGGVKLVLFFFLFVLFYFVFNVIMCL